MCKGKEKVHSGHKCGKLSTKLNEGRGKKNCVWGGKNLWGRGWFLYQRFRSCLRPSNRVGVRLSFSVDRHLIWFQQERVSYFKFHFFCPNWTVFVAIHVVLSTSENLQTSQFVLFSPGYHLLAKPPWWVPVSRPLSFPLKLISQSIWLSVQSNSLEPLGSPLRFPTTLNIQWPLFSNLRDFQRRSLSLYHVSLFIPQKLLRPFVITGRQSTR